MDKREELIELYDLYYSLLTDKQKEYFENYYFMDLSLTEIAENFEISRNAVFDQLKRVSAILYDYEDKLKLMDKLKKISELKLEDSIKEEILNIIKE